MDFDCDEIRSGVQKRRAEGGGEVRVFIGPGDGAGGQRQIAHSAGRHVAAPDFQAVQIDHRAVVAQKVRVQACEQHRIRDGEDPSKIVGDEFRHGVGICSLFSIVGLFTRINALLLFGALSGAILQNLLAGRDPQLAILYTLVVLTLAFIGGGRISLDAMFFSKAEQSTSRNAGMGRELKSI